MKTIYKKLLFLFLLLPLSVLAQDSISGVVVDKKSNQPLPGVNVAVQGTAKGASTDFDGKFQLAGLKNGDVLVFSFIGYTNETVKYTGQKSVSISLEESANQLQEVVVQVGYGSVKKKDATGSVAVVSSKDFNKGAVLTADQLLIGKAAGVRIHFDGGQPDSSPNIRIRGISSLKAEASPLIVIDNVPIDNRLAAGQSNPLAYVNPNDIETFTILKDASATAIYGSRASNGVIIITTKKGSTGAPKFNYTSTFSFGKADNTIGVMDGPTFANFVTQNYPASASLLGIPDPNNPGQRIISNTDWQKEIFRSTTSQDHNLSASAAIFGNVPFRASMGYNRTEGVVKTNDYQRLSLGFKVSPTYFDGHLKVDVNAKGLSTKKNDIDTGAVIGSALSMDPTKPVFGDSPNNRFGGYYQSIITQNADGSPLSNGAYVTEGSLNPLARLNQRERPMTIDKFLGNIELDYKMHFLPELRAVVNAGLELSQSSITERFSNNALETYRFESGNNDPSTNYVFNPGLNYYERQTIDNKTLDAYLIYTKKLTGAISRVEVQAGHSFQSFVNSGNKDLYEYDVTTGLRKPTVDLQNPNARYYGKMTMESYFGRANIDFYNKYLLTMTLRGDASSLFPADRRWGYFPAAGLAWKVKEESFLKNSKTVNDLKIRVGYGITGNSDIRSQSYYPYTALFIAGSPSGQYLPGINIYSAQAFNPNLTWEKTATTNVGVDFDILKNGFLSGSIDAYVRKTEDLLAPVNFPTGQFLTNIFTKNAATMTNKGIEVNLTAKVISSDNMNWSVNGNVAYNIGNVDQIEGATRIQVDNGKLPGIGRQLTYHAEGEQPYSAWVFAQVYDEAGKPIPDAFVDRNGDGVITDEGDKYYIAMTPNWTFGFGTSFNYKKFDFNASFRGQFGGNVYNSSRYSYGARNNVNPTNSNTLTNILNESLPFERIAENQVVSDYFIEDATFLRCESISLGYKFDKLYKSSSMRLYVSANNVFLLTKYSGQDPENFNGIDTNFYPRPRTFNVGVSIDF